MNTEKISTEQGVTVDAIPYRAAAPEIVQQLVAARREDLERRNEMDRLRASTGPSTSDVQKAAQLIRRAMPWLKGSESAMADLDRAVRLLGGAA